MVQQPKLIFPPHRAQHQRSFSVLVLLHALPVLRRLQLGPANGMFQGCDNMRPSCNRLRYSLYGIVWFRHVRSTYSEPVTRSRQPSKMLREPLEVFQAYDVRIRDR